MPHNEVVEHTDPTVLQAREGDDKCVTSSPKQSCFQDSTEESYSPYPSRSLRKPHQLPWNKQSHLQHNRAPEAEGVTVITPT